MTSNSPTLAPYYVSSGPKHVSSTKEFTSSHFQAFQTRHFALCHFTLVPAPSVAPFFCFPTDRRPGFTPLTANYFTSSLKRLIVSLGLDPANYSPHSFRRGGATYAYQAGVSEHLIKLHGDWRSDAYQVYLSLTPVNSCTGG